MNKRSNGNQMVEKESGDHDWKEWKRDLILHQIIMNERSGYVLQRDDTDPNVARKKEKKRIVG